MTRDFKIYIVTFYAQNVNLPALHQYLTDSVDVLGYWNHIPLVYCVKTRLNALNLRDRLRPFMPDPMLVAEINPADMNGYMFTPQQWNWFWEPAVDRSNGPAVGGLGMASLFALSKPPE
jgi:hypothetical protein